MSITTKRILGLATVKMGPIAVDGGMSTALVEIGDTVRDSVVISNAEGTKQEFFIEEQDDAVESIITAKGTMTVVWSTVNTDPATMVKFFGGTVTAASGGTPAFWSAPDTIPDIEESIEITDTRGNKVEIARAKLSAKMTLNFKRSALGALDVTATVLVPTKAGEPSLKLSKVAV